MFPSLMYGPFFWTPEVSPPVPMGAGLLDLCPLPCTFFDEARSNLHLDPFEHESFVVHDLQYLCFPSPVF